MNQKRPPKMKARAITQDKWLRNVMKSLGQSSSMLISELVPATADLVSSNTETVTEMVRDMRNLRVTNKRLMSNFENNEYMQIAKEALKNAKADLKSGNIYNSARVEQVMSDSMGGDDFDFDFDDSGFDDGFDVDVSDEEDGGGTSVVVNANITEDNPMVQATVAQTKAIVDTAEANQKAQLAIANQAMVMDKRMLDVMTSGITAMNANLASIVEFNSTNMSKFTGAAIAYYQDSLEELKAINASLKTLTERGAAPSQPGKVDERAFKEDLGLDVFGSNTFNIEAYKNLVKRQLGSATDSNMFTSAVKNFLLDKDALRTMAANPLSFVSTAIVGKLVPSMLQDSLKTFDKTLKEFFPALLLKLGSLTDHENPLLSFFGSVFGIQPKRKESIDLGRYVKGPIPFDGQTKYAIVNIIPAYLRKILSAVSGREEIAVDWKTGTLEDLSSMEKSWREDERRARYGPVTDIIANMERRLDTYVTADAKEKEDFQRKFRIFMDKYLKSHEFVNPNRTKDKDGMLVDEVGKIYDFGNPELNRLVRLALLSNSREDQMRLAGSGKAESMAAIRKRNAEYEEGQDVNNAFNLFGDKSSTALFKRRSDGKLERDANGRPIIDLGGSIGSDKFGLTPADYLRDIRELLTKGIIVYPNASGNYSSIDTDDGDEGSDRRVPEHVAEILESMKNEKKKWAKANDRDRARVLSEEQIEDINKSGRRRALSSYSSIASMSDQQILEDFIESDRVAEAEREAEADAIKTFGGDLGKRWSKIKEKLASIYKLPSKAIINILNRADDAMYKMIFGGHDDDGKGFLVTSLENVANKITSGFEKMLGFMDEKFFSPIKKFLFDGPNSLKGRWDNSELKKNITAKTEQMKDYLFGQKVDGTRQHGLFSAVYQNMQIMGAEMRNYITGAPFKNDALGIDIPKNENSVFSHFGNFFKDYTTHLKHYFFGDGKGESAKGLVGGAVSSIKDGFQSFADAIFGTHIDENGERQSNFLISQFAKDMKKGAPKAFAVGVAGAGLGLVNALGGGGFLGSLFLPGGPIGGAILGTTLGFLNQSEGFKNFMFGKEDENGERMGGLISKRTQDFFAKHKTAIIGGATIGSLKSMLGIGILPSLFGGPIVGAALGIGTSLLTRSEKFKELLFGKEDEEGNKIGGLISKITDKFKDENGENKFGKIAAGALGGATMGLIASKFGLLGSFFLGGGPIFGALMGVAGGIALTSDKWKKALFGEWDEDKQIRKGGLFGKFINWTNLEIFQPLKLKFKEINLNVQEWFESSIANPFREALAPLREEFTRLVDNMKDMFYKGWESFKGFLGMTFEKFVGQPFGTFMEEKVLKPLKSFFNSILRGAGAIVGNVLAAPFKGLNAFADSLQTKHEKQAVKDRQKDGWDTLLGRDGKGQGMSAWERVKYWLAGYGSKSAKEEAMDADVPYRKARNKMKEENKAKTKAKYDKKRAKLEEEREELDRRRGRGKELDYEDTYIDEDGNEQETGFGDFRSPEDIARAKEDEEERTKNANKPSTDATVVDDEEDEGYDGSRKKNRKKQREKNKKKRGKRGNNASVAPSASSDTNVPPRASTDSTIVNPVNDATVAAQEETGASDPENITTPSGGNASSGSRPTDSTVVSDSSSNRPKSSSSSKSSGKSKDKVIANIADDVRNIAREVNGQLDGVGSNVYKIRKIVQKANGIGDEDLLGASNRDRKTLFGKLRGLLYKPFETVASFIATPFRKVGEAVTWVGDKIYSAGKAVLSVPVKVAKAMGSFMGDLYEGVKLFGKSLLTIPAVIGDAIGTTLTVAKDIIKEIAPAFGKVLMGTASMINHTLVGIGEGMRESFKGIGVLFTESAKALGGLVRGMAGLVPTMFEVGTEIFKMTAHGALGIVKASMDVIGTGFSLLLSPLKGLFGRGKEKLVFDDRKPLRVRIVGSDISVPVHETSTTGNKGSTTPSLGGVRRTFRAVGASIDQIRRAASNGRMDSNQSAAMLEASIASDAIEEEREKRDAEVAEQKADIERRAEDARSETAEKRQAEIAEEEEKKKREEYEQAMLEQSTRTADATTSHTSSWEGIFGKKGLLAVALLAGLPLLKKAFEFIMKFLGGGGFNPLGFFSNIPEMVTSFFNNEEGRTDAEGNMHENEGAKETAVKGTIKNAPEFLFKMGRHAGAFIKKVKAGAGFLSKPFKKAAKAGSDNIPIKNLKGFAKIKATLFKILRAVIKSAKRFVKDEGTIGKALASAENFFTGKLDKLLVNSADEVAEAVAKDAATVASGVGIILKSAFAVYDGISGAFEVRRIFRVSKDAVVTASMRAVAGIIKALTEMSFAWSLVFNLLEEYSVVPVKKELASLLLRIFDQGSVGIMVEGQERFDQELEAYNAEHGTEMTAAGWNDMQNKTLFQSIFGKKEKVLPKYEYPVDPVTGKEYSEITDLEGNSYKMTRGTVDFKTNPDGNTATVTGVGLDGEPISVQTDMVFKGMADEVKQNNQKTNKQRIPTRQDGAATVVDQNKNTKPSGKRPELKDSLFGRMLLKFKSDEEKRSKEKAEKIAKEKMREEEFNTFIIAYEESIGRKLSDQEREEIKFQWYDTKRKEDIDAKHREENMASSQRKKESDRRRDERHVKRTEAVMENYNKRQNWNKNRTKGRQYGVYRGDDRPTGKDAQVEKMARAEKFDPYKGMDSSERALERRKGLARKISENMKQYNANQRYEDFLLNQEERLEARMKRLDRTREDRIKRNKMMDELRAKSNQTFFDTMRGFKNTVTGYSENQSAKNKAFLEERQKTNATVRGAMDFYKTQKYSFPTNNTKAGRTGLAGSGPGNIKSMSQSDPRWANKAVGSGNMKDLGCGPTAMSMIASGLGAGSTPDQFQDFANVGGYASSNGVEAGFIGASANAMGLASRQTLLPDGGTIASGVRNGPMVLLGRSDNSGLFTRAGHYVVATDAGGGKVKIRDPRGAGYNKTVPISSLDGTMSAWEFRGGGRFDKGRGSRYKKPKPQSSSNILGLQGKSFAAHANEGIQADKEYKAAVAAMTTQVVESKVADKPKATGNAIYDAGENLSYNTLADAYGQMDADTPLMQGGTLNNATAQVIRKMESLEGRLKYSQSGGRENPEKSGYSDCSGTIAYCYRTTIGIKTGNNTLEMLKHGALVVSNTSGNKNHHQTIEQYLAPGDLLIFGNSSTSRHVEMYIGNDTLMGHGGPGRGPTRKKLSTYTHKQKFNCARRYVDATGKALMPGDDVGVSTQIEHSSGDASSGTILDKIASEFSSMITSVLFGGFDATDSSLGSDIGGSAMATAGLGSFPPSETSQVGTDPSNKDLILRRKLTSFEPISAAKIDAFIEKKAKGGGNAGYGKMRGMGKYIIEASKATGLDPRYILAHAAWESGWGTSDYARTRGNYFGIGAFNDNPDNAYRFSSGGQGLIEGAKWINQNYTSKGADSLYRMLYNGPKGAYAVDKNKQPSTSWAKGIANIMAQMGGISGAGNGNRGGIDLGFQFPSNTPIRMAGAGTVKRSSSPMALNSFKPVTGGINNSVKIYGAGNVSGSSDAAILMEMVRILKSIDSNTGGSKDNLTLLLEKYNSGQMGGAGMKKHTDPIVAPNTPKTSFNDVNKGNAYGIAKSIARGKYA